MKKNFEAIIVVAISVLVISLGTLPNINYAFSKPINTIYLGVHNFVFDYFIYLSYITQGQKGSLLTYESHTSETQPGSWIHLYYLAAGWVSRPFNIPPYIVYHLMRVLGAVIFAGTVYWFVSFFGKNSLHRIFLFFLAYASAGFPFLLSNWSGFDVVKRSVFLPHGLIQNSLTLLIIGFLIKYEESQRIKYLTGAGICLFITNLFSPFHSGMALASYFFYSLMDFGHIRKRLVNNLFLLLFLLPTFIYVQYAYSQGVLAWLKKWDASALEVINFKEYVLGLGPIFFLGVIGILLCIRRKSYKYFVLIFMTLSSLFFIFNLKADAILGVNNFKFLGVPIHVFLGILSFVTLTMVAKKLKKFKNVFLILILLILFIISLPTYYSSYKKASHEYDRVGSYDAPFNVFMPKSIYEGVVYLKENTDFNKDIVLSRMIAGNFIPGLSGNRVYLGHPVSTMNFPEKQIMVEKFFKGEMGFEEAKLFFLKNGIKYIFAGYEEIPRPDVKKYPFLKPVFSNIDVVIYKVEL